MSILKRGKNLYFKRHVPKRYEAVEPRGQVWVALNTDSQREAVRRADEIWRNFVTQWEALLAGGSDDEDLRYRAAQDLARARGFRFLPVERVAELPIRELAARIEATLDAKGDVNPVFAKAILGTAEKPKITLSRALNLYWDHAADKARGKSADQIRRWRNPRIKAFKNLIAVVGDIPVTDLDRSDLLAFRKWWWAKITAEGLTPNSGNKDMSHIASTLRLVNNVAELNLTLPFGNIMFDEGDKAKRLEFTEAWIREKILAPGALDGLNLEARCILLGMINTGYRPSEAQGLRPQDIRLDTNIPHISIEPEGRKLKNAHSRRVIPLVGVSLEAFRSCPQGFPRYRDKPGLTVTVNKYMRENGLMESPDHTLYGLRHAFEDRMLDRGVDERIRRDLMGHALTRQRYGSGAGLAKMFDAVQSVAI